MFTLKHVKGGNIYVKILALSKNTGNNKIMDFSDWTS